MHEASGSNGTSMGLKTVVAIPARYQSTRLPGKPLADICGKTMIRRVYERALKAKNVSEVLVATDDERIFREVVSFKGQAVMTSPDHRSGTDRIAEVFQDRIADIVINVQGDEPFLEPECIEALITPFIDDPDLKFATLKTPITDPKDFLDPTIAKLVVDQDDYVLYFSRSPIPFAREGMDVADKMFEIKDLPDQVCYKQIGLYGYRRDFLLQFASWKPAPLEKLEKLEQLRALFHSVRVKAVTVDHSGFSIDTPEDLERARQLLNSSHEPKE